MTKNFMDWNEEKKKFLRTHYGKLTAEEIAGQLGTTKMGVQVEASRLKLTNGRHKHLRDEQFGPGREYECVERKRTLDIEEREAHRNHNCRFYDKCLDHACEMNWKAWSCKQCKHRHNRRGPAKLAGAEEILKAVMDE